MLTSLYFFAVGGLFYKLFLRPPDKHEPKNLFKMSLIETRPIVNKKAAKSNA